MKTNYKINKGLFSFMSRRGYSIHDMYSVLKFYAIKNNIPIPKKNRIKWYVTISILAESDFQLFRKIFKEHSKTYDNLGNYRDGYSEWWCESNSDGSFAYNGVADDF